MDDSVVQIVGPEDHWVLERLARQLAAKLPYARFVPWLPEPNPHTLLHYYVNYALFEQRTQCLDVGFVTHEDEAQQFWQKVQQLHHCVSMSALYAGRLRERGIRHVTHLPMGVDCCRFRPRLVLGVLGRLEHPRKGQAQVEAARSIPYVDVECTHGQAPTSELPAFLQRIDCLFVPATVEGGPLALLEALAAGKPVVAPEGVGLTDEFGRSPHIRTYRSGEAESLRAVLAECFQEKLARSRLVQHRNLDQWAEAHHHLFSRLVQERGHALPAPHPDFRFGMLAEARVSPAEDATVIEPMFDRAARHLYFGEAPKARAEWEQAAALSPSVRAWLDRRSTPERASPPPASPSRPLLSLITNVLDSHEALRRQLLFLNDVLTTDCELIVVDDGSSPALEGVCHSVSKRYRFQLAATHDRRPWTQPAARNFGASLAQADRLLFFDIDHIVTREVLDACLRYSGDKLHWRRAPGALDGQGRLVTDATVLRAYGLSQPASDVHPNSFLIRRELFFRVGGYDESFCGRYGGDDIDFNRRYDALCRAGQARAADVQGSGYYFPDPAVTTDLFHSLERHVTAVSHSGDA